MSDADHLRETARRLLEGAGEQRATDLRAVVELAYDVIAEETEHAFRRYRREEEGEAAIGPEDAQTRFLVQKLTSRSLLGGLVKADRPFAYLRAAAFHHAVDLLRRAPPIGRISSEHDPGDDDRDELDEWIDRERAATPAPAAQLLAELSEDDRILLEVLYVERAPLSKDAVSWLAKRRGVPASTVERELAARADAVDEERRKAEIDAEERLAIMMRLQVRRAMIARIVAEQDGGRSAPPVELTDELRARLRTREAIERCTAEERAALLASIEGRLATQARLRDEALGKARDPFALHPDYASVASILGLIDGTTDPSERGRVLNTITVRARRLRLRLRELMDRAAREATG